MMIWMARSLPLAAVAAALLIAPTPAEACSPPPSLALFPQLADGARTGVPTDGVIAFRADAYGELTEALGLLNMDVTQDGMPVAGAIETIELSTSDEFGSIRTDLFIVWRPEAAFAPSSDYVASIAVADEWDPKGLPTVTTLEISTAADAAGALPAPELLEVELGVNATGSGPRVCCDDGNSCGFPACAALEESDHPRLGFTLGAAGDDPLATQGYVRLLAGVDDGLEAYAVAGIAAEVDGFSLQHTFDAAAGNYCIGAELVSFIDGSALPIVSQCEDHGDLELATAPNSGFDAFLEQCVGEPYWEDTDEPYVPDGGTGGDESGDGGSSGGGDADGGDADGGDADGGDADGGSGDDGSGGDGGSGQNDGDGGGCACRVDAERSWWPGLAGLFVLGAVRAARRRR